MKISPIFLEYKYYLLKSKYIINCFNIQYNIILYIFLSNISNILRILMIFILILKMIYIMEVF